VLRKNFGWSQGALAEKSELDRSVITNIEIRRRENITLDELMALAKAFGVSPSLLLGARTEADYNQLGSRLMDELEKAAA